MMHLNGITACVLCCLFKSAIAGVNVPVLTTIGDIIGTSSVNERTFDGTQLKFTTFLGIPFAEPATGERRFHKPVAKPAFTEPFIANRPGDGCPQLATTQTKTFSEDCLNLNIFVPGESIDKETPKAVMVYVYGGGYVKGYHDLYHSTTFAAVNDVILVTFNYRVNVFGFLASGENGLSGNNGLWDQQMAIKWVHDHIAEFGGDVNRVTLFGASAGAASVVHQAMYDGNQGLFQRVVAQSGSAFCPWSFQMAPNKHYNDFANKAGCASPNSLDVVNCLQSLSVAEILQIDRRAMRHFKPIYDGDFIKVTQADFIDNTSSSAPEIINRLSQFDLLMGVVSEEGGIVYLMRPDGLASFVAKYGGNITEGISVEVFEKVAQDLLVAYLDPTLDIDLAISAIAQEYIDWSNPGDLQNNRKRLYDVEGDFQFKAGIVATANAHSRAAGTGSLYFYEFDHQPSWSTLPDWFTGAIHGDEINFVLGHHNFSTDPASELPGVEIELSTKMMRYWTNFAKTGNPNSAEVGVTTADLTTWPPYDSPQQSYIVFNDNVTAFPVRQHPIAKAVHFFTDYFPRLTTQCRPTTCVTCGSGDRVSAGVLVTLMAAIVTAVSG